MKWCVVADVIKHVTDKGMAVLGRSIHLSGYKSGRASPALVLLTAQAGLNLVVWSEQAGLYWSSCDDQVQGSQRVPPYICCPMICIIPFHFCWLSFSLPLCLPSLSSLLQNEQPTPSYFFPPLVAALLHQYPEMVFLILVLSNPGLIWLCWHSYLSTVGLAMLPNRTPVLPFN